MINPEVVRLIDSEIGRGIEGRRSSSEVFRLGEDDFEAGRESEQNEPDSFSLGSNDSDLEEMMKSTLANAQLPSAESQPLAGQYLNDNHIKYNPICLKYGVKILADLLQVGEIKSRNSDNEPQKYNPKEINENFFAGLSGLDDFDVSNHKENPRYYFGSGEIYSEYVKARFWEISKARDDAGLALEDSESIRGLYVIRNQHKHLDEISSRRKIIDGVHKTAIDKIKLC